MWLSEMWMRERKTERNSFSVPLHFNEKKTNERKFRFSFGFVSKRKTNATRKRANSRYIKFCVLLKCRFWLYYVVRMRIRHILLGFIVNIISFSKREREAEESKTKQETKYIHPYPLNRMWLRTKDDSWAKIRLLFFSYYSNRCCHFNYVENFLSFFLYFIFLHLSLSLFYSLLCQITITTTTMWAKKHNGKEHSVHKNKLKFIENRIKKNKILLDRRSEVRSCKRRRRKIRRRRSRKEQKSFCLFFFFFLTCCIVLFCFIYFKISAPMEKRWSVLSPYHIESFSRNFIFHWISITFA